MTVKYPEMIESLPDVDLSFPGVRGKLLQAGEKQIVFFEIDPIAKVPPHSHKAQWGVILDGELELTIDGETKTLTKGDTYYVPAGVEHAAAAKTPVLAMDLFNEPARYKPRP